MGSKFKKVVFVYVLLHSVGTVYLKQICFDLYSTRCQILSQLVI